MRFLKGEEEDADLLHRIGSSNPAKKNRTSPNKKRPRCGSIDGFIRPLALPLHQPTTRFECLLLAAEIALQQLENENKCQVRPVGLGPPDASKEKKRKGKATATSPPHASTKRRKTSTHDASSSRTPTAAAAEERIRGVEAVFELPLEFKRKVREMGGKEEEAVLVIQKHLFGSDTNPNSGRFSIPFNQVANDFLTPQEKSALHSPGTKIRNVPLIEPDATSVCPITLARWNMSGNGIYNLITNWNHVRKSNALVTGDIVQLWAFRTHPYRKLCLAMVLHDTNPYSSLERRENNSKSKSGHG